ncbi:MAG: hypothetical protein IJ104_02950 [Methanobrevibacter sp.]|nr:hypothetical protein [Methanobrevibacter sp.]
MSPEYQIIIRTQYPIPNRSNIDERVSSIAGEEITRMYEEIGIVLNLDKLTFIR